jgi:uncharacterized protein YjbJ (UPF0337 family)
MNENIIKGNWNEVRGAIQKKWGKLTDDDLAQILGERTRLLGSLQKTYGYAEDEAEKQVREWEKTLH